MHVRPAVVITLLFLIATSASRADEKTPLFSGPQAGEKLPALKVKLAYGKDANRIVDFIEQSAGKPTLLVIVNGSNRPAARLTRILMNFAEMRGKALFAGVVYLDSDATAAGQQLKRASSWWKVGPPVGVSIDGGEGPGSYGLNRNVNLTVLVAVKGRVTHNFALVQPSETDARKILKPIVAQVGGRVPTNAEVMFLSVPTHKPPNVRWRSAPADVKMRELICTALAAKNVQAARAAAAAVGKYVGDDKVRQAVLGNAAAILLEGRTKVRGIPIVRHLRDWKMKYDTRVETKR